MTDKTHNPIVSLDYVKTSCPPVDTTHPIPEDMEKCKNKKCGKFGDEIIGVVRLATEQNIVRKVARNMTVIMDAGGVYDFAMSIGKTRIWKLV